MFRSWDEYSNFDVENPVVIDSLWNKYHDFDEDETIMFDVDIVIDTRKLDAEQENHLVNAIEDASHSRGNLSVDWDEKFVTGEYGEKWNRIIISGCVEEDALLEIYDLINDYNVKFIKDCAKEI